MISSRDLVKQTLEFKNPERAPRHLWTLPWAEIHHSEYLKKIIKDFPDDIVGVPMGDFATSEGFTRRPGDPEGEPFEVGTYLDVWGCSFINRQKGVIGEIKDPLIKDEEWLDDSKLKLPEQVINFNREKVNEFCRSTDKFVLAGDWARPFERLQFIRGTEQLYMDLMLKPNRMYNVFEKIHDFYCRQLKAWCETDVDAVWFMDDWGSQRNLLINPGLWIEFFKPMYKDYIDMAHKYGKKIFMHSDGYIIDILPHLIELGLDAVNSQIFCMGAENLKKFKGQITFWGEIDRQHLLPEGTKEDIANAVRKVKGNLWNNGGCIAQCEFGPGAKPENIYTVFKTWNEI
jgi:uroporphyrinogen decarboxylase